MFFVSVICKNSVPSKAGKIELFTIFLFLSGIDLLKFTLAHEDCVFLLYKISFIMPAFTKSFKPFITVC